MVFGLNTGEISRPFFTPQGIHIVKVLEQQEILPFEKVKGKIIHCQTRRHGMDKGTRAFVEKLKKEYHYMSDKVGIDELLAKGSTSRTLFTLDGKIYGRKRVCQICCCLSGRDTQAVRSFHGKDNSGL